MKYLLVVSFALLSVVACSGGKSFNASVKGITVTGTVNDPADVPAAKAKVEAALAILDAKK